MTSRERRAMQFQAFDALKGFGEYIRAQERFRTEKREVSEDEAEIISSRLLHLEKGMQILVRHYTGNAYITTRGRVTAVDFEYRYMKVADKKIWFDDVYRIEVG